jgi:hypothetical protein
MINSQPPLYSTVELELLTAELSMERGVSGLGVFIVVH